MQSSIQYQKLLSTGVDEFTGVLQPTNPPYDTTDWPDVAEKMADRFIEKSLLVNLFGELTPTDKRLTRMYTSGLTFENRPWLLTIAWNEHMPNNGICVRFSAHAWAAYRAKFKEQYSEPMTIHRFLKMVQDCSYNFHLSRIDLTADYMNYPQNCSPHEIYKQLVVKKKYLIQNHAGKSTISEKTGRDKAGHWGTFYVGSTKEKSNGFLRCYDKKQEQLEKYGFRLAEAQACKSWMRCEAVFRHDYAKQITEQLMGITSDQDEQKWIAKTITDRYRFYDTKRQDVIPVTEDLMDIAAGITTPPLNSPSPRDNDLERQVMHTVKNSGLFPLINKFEGLWGAAGSKAIEDYLAAEYADYKRRRVPEDRELRTWFNKHAAELSTCKPKDFLKPVYQEVGVVYLDRVEI